MVARAPSNWNVEEDNLLNGAFAAMAINWPTPQREDLVKFFLDLLFPASDRDTLWKVVYHTSNTIDGVPYSKMFIKLYDGLSVWFCNLRILQDRVKLGLIDSYCVACGLGISQLGEFVAKIEAIRVIVGTKRLMDSYLPELIRHPT